jgi:hypothetical protein
MNSIKELPERLQPPSTLKRLFGNVNEQQEMRRKDEVHLRSIIAGKDLEERARLSNIWAPDVVEVLAKKYDEKYAKYSKEEKEYAKQGLETEFGIQFKKKEDASGKLLKQLMKTVAGISKSFEALTEMLSEQAAAIKNIDSAVNSLQDKMLKLASPTTNVSPGDLQPISIPYEGKEYLYYPGAPTGRKLYEKSKTGTAGRIAPKEGQDFAEQVFIETTRIMNEVDKLVPKDTSSSVLTQEPDERIYELEKALEEALKKVLPKILEELDLGGGDGVDIDFGDRRGRGRMGRRGSRMPGSVRRPAGTGAAESVAEKTASKVAAQEVAKAGAESAAEKGTATAASKTALKTVLKKIPLGIGLVFGLGYGAYELLVNKDPTAAALDVASGAASTVPGIGTAASIGIDVAGAAYQIDKEKKKAESGVAPPALPETRYNTTTTAPTLRPTSPSSMGTGQTIIEQNREQQLLQQSVTNNSSVMQGEPVQIINRNTQNIVNNTTPPENMQIHDTDSTYNRLMMQDLEHPSSYGSLNGG